VWSVTPHSSPEAMLPRVASPLDPMLKNQDPYIISLVTLSVTIALAQSCQRDRTASAMEQ